MSRTHTYALRILAAAGLLGGAHLIAPETTQAQNISYDRALLNHSTAVIPVEARLRTAWTTPSDPEATSRFNGERALLGRVDQVHEVKQTTGASQANLPVDGERALLGRRNAFPPEAM